MQFEFHTPYLIMKKDKNNEMRYYEIEVINKSQKIKNLYKLFYRDINFFEWTDISQVTFIEPVKKSFV